MNNLTGKKYNMLTAIEPVGKNKWGALFWTFQCECGNKKKIEPFNVVHNRVKSCEGAHKIEDFLNWIEKLCEFRGKNG